MRAIDADKLQKAIPAEEDNIMGMGMTYDEMKAYNDGIDEQWKKIVNAPTIEPERKTGKWILHQEQEKNIFDVKTIECSVCGDKCLVQCVEKEKYCRNCGAKMEGTE